MNIAEQLEQKERELIACYSIMQLQQTELEKAHAQIKHLEEILKHKALILDREE